MLADLYPPLPPTVRLALQLASQQAPAPPPAGPLAPPWLPAQACYQRGQKQQPAEEKQRNDFSQALTCA